MIIKAIIKTDRTIAKLDILLKHLLKHKKDTKMVPLSIYSASIESLIVTERTIRSLLCSLLRSDKV